MQRTPPAQTRPKDKPRATVETHLANLEDRLDLLRAQVRQSQQLASLGTAAATIAHEVNNLLTPILSYAQAALEGGDTELQKKALTVTMKNVQMLVAMADRVLQISAAKPAEIQAVSVCAAARSAAESLCRDLSKDGIALSIKVDESLTAWADPLQLQQVLFNLFLNARDAMKSLHSGRLTVTAGRDKDRTIIEVQDTGKGVPPDLLPHIFDPLKSSKSTDGNGRERCKGLGLALCRDLVEENGGTIDVTSEPGAGTKFTITLPTERPAEA
jgi:signal transduction histidine kinase